MLCVLLEPGDDVAGLVQRLAVNEQARHLALAAHVAHRRRKQRHGTQQLTGQMRVDAEDFLTDFTSYANRQTNRKERARLQDTLSFLEKVYL